MGTYPFRRKPKRKTPSSNIRGLQISKKAKKMRNIKDKSDYSKFGKKEENLGFKIDWLSFTVDTSKDINFKILKMLGYNVELFDDVAGKNFFNAGLSIGGGFVKVFYNNSKLPLQKGASDLHDYVFTGVGCTDLSQKINGDWLKLFQDLKDFGVNFRRIDIALDDFNSPPLVDFPLIERKLKKKEFKSSKRRYNILRDVSTSGELAGETVYLGSRKTGTVGHTVLRIYQKYLQMISKHQEAQMPLPALKSKSWIRWELEITKQKAVAMIDLILERNSISDAYYSVLRDTIDFLVPTKNKAGQIYQNKAKWKTCKWWEDFLNGIQKSKLQDPDKIFNLGSALDWIRFSVVPTLQMLDRVYKPIGVDFYSILKNLNSMELSKKQQRLLLESQSMTRKELGLYLNYFIEGKNSDEK